MSSKNLKSSEIEKVLRSGRRYKGRSLLFYILKADQTKCAFIAPKRLGNAVTRNRLKRVLREASRKSQFNEQTFDSQDLHMIFMASNGTKESTLQNIIDDYNAVFTLVNNDISKLV
jgi:ribonuclease P protein component